MCCVRSPDILEVDKEAPTVQASAVPLGLQKIVDHGFDLCEKIFGGILMHTELQALA